MNLLAVGRQAYLRRLKLTLAAATAGLAVTAASAGAATFEQDTEYKLSETGKTFEHRGLATGDFNGDGYNDIFIADEDASAVKVYLNDGLGKFTLNESDSITTGDVPTAVEVGDLNGDGSLDVVVGDAIGDVYLLTQKTASGEGGTIAKVSSGGGEPIRDIELSDLNDDDKLDLAWLETDKGTSTTSIYTALGDGVGKAAMGSSLSLSATSYAISIGDFVADGDQGCPDIATAKAATNDLQILINDCLGTFAPAAPQTVPTVNGMLVGGDYITGGLTELITSNIDDDTVSLFKEDTGLFTLAGTFDSDKDLTTVSSIPAYLAAGDPNGDSNLDVATSNLGSTTISVLFGDGAGTLSDASRLKEIEVGSKPNDLRFADLGPDGIDDLIVITNDANGFRVLLTDPVPPEPEPEPEPEDGTDGTEEESGSGSESKVIEKTVVITESATVTAPAVTVTTATTATAAPLAVTVKAAKTLSSKKLKLSVKSNRNISIKATAKIKLGKKKITLTPVTKSIKAGATSSLSFKLKGKQKAQLLAYLKKGLKPTVEISISGATTDAPNADTYSTKLKSKLKR